METGTSQRLPWKIWMPQFVQDDRFLLGDCGVEPDEELSGEILRCYDLEAVETVWKTNIKTAIDSIDVSPDGSLVAVQAYKFGWIITSNKLPVYIIDASTGKTILKLLEDEAWWSGGIRWIAE
jgi:hypothetical protein